MNKNTILHIAGVCVVGCACAYALLIVLGIVAISDGNEHCHCAQMATALRDWVRGVIK